MNEDGRPDIVTMGTSERGTGFVGVQLNNGCFPPLPDAGAPDAGSDGAIDGADAGASG